MGDLDATVLVDLGGDLGPRLPGCPASRDDGRNLRPDEFEELLLWPFVIPRDWRRHVKPHLIVDRIQRTDQVSLMQPRTLGRFVIGPDPTRSIREPSGLDLVLARPALGVVGRPNVETVAVR